MINLNNLLHNLKLQLSAQLPEAINTAFEESIYDLKMQRIGQSAHKPGETLPSFTLPNTKGELINSDQLLLENDKLIIAFFRGGWCPYCNLELKVLHDVLPQIKAKRAALVAVSPQMIEKSVSMSADNPFAFDILWDKDNKYAKELNIAFDLQASVLLYYQQLGIHLEKYNGNEENSLPIPAVFVMDKNKTVTFTFIDADYTERVNIEELLNNL